MLTKEEKEKKCAELAHMLYLNCGQPDMIDMVINYLKKYRDGK